MTYWYIQLYLIEKYTSSISSLLLLACLTVLPWCKMSCYESDLKIGLYLGPVAKCLQRQDARLSLAHASFKFKLAFSRTGIWQCLGD